MNQTTEIRYKLTDENSQTMNQTQWGEGVEHATSGEGDLCGSGWLHCYDDPFLAVILNPRHADFKNPLLWEVEVSGKHLTDKGLKEGWTKMKTIRQIPLPKITDIQRVRFAILCTASVYNDPSWRKWAQDWLDNKDRSKAAANVAGAAYAAANVAYAAATAAANAAWAAAWAAAAATYAAWDAAGAWANAAAYDAAYDAWAAACAAGASTDIDLKSLIKLAMSKKKIDLSTMKR